MRFRATAVTTAPTISAPARKRQGKFYLSNVYCVIGQTHNQVPSTQVQQRWGDGRLEISAASVPSTGSWRQGDVVWKTNPSILAGNPGYHLMGWRRITTGTGQTVGTDWAEMRIPARGDVITVSHSGGIYSIDASKGNAFHLNLDGSNRVVTILGAADAQHILIRILRTSAGANTPGFDEMFDFGSLSYTISAVDKVDHISVLHYNNSYHIVDVKTGYPKEPP